MLSPYQVTGRQGCSSSSGRPSGDGPGAATLLERSARADLPLIAGWRANNRVDEALAILAVAGPLGPRIRGLVRVGERRWDLVLDDGPTIMLPESEPVLALSQVLALDAAEDLLARDLTHVDMRDPRRPTLRLNRTAAQDPSPLQSDFEE